MIAKIKLIADGKAREGLKIYYIFKKTISWPYHELKGPFPPPQAGMTLIIPQESFRFYITHIVADLRTSKMILVERRRFDMYMDAEKQMKKLADQLVKWSWAREVVK